MRFWVTLLSGASDCCSGIFLFCFQNLETDGRYAKLFNNNKSIFLGWWKTVSGHHYFPCLSTFEPKRRQNCDQWTIKRTAWNHSIVGLFNLFEWVEHCHCSEDRRWGNSKNDLAEITFFFSSLWSVSHSNTFDLSPLRHSLVPSQMAVSKPEPENRQSQGCWVAELLYEPQSIHAAKWLTASSRPQCIAFERFLSIEHRQYIRTL